MKKTYFRKLEQKHTKQLREDLKKWVDEETLRRPHFAKKARQSYLRERVLSLTEHIRNFQQVMDNKRAGVLRVVARDYIMQLLPDYKRTLKQYLYTYTDKIKNEFISEQDIETAKEYPIDNLVRVERNFFLCLDHDDHNPSCYYYKDTNSCHCFSCGWTGDSIDVYQKLYNVDFKVAVKALQ